LISDFFFIVQIIYASLLGLQRDKRKLLIRRVSLITNSRVRHEKKPSIKISTDGKREHTDTILWFDDMFLLVGAEERLADE
jgi:hypothetical protein